MKVEGLCHLYSAGTPFAKAAIDHIDLRLYRGECLGVIGHTGSGKSTLIQHLNGLLKPTSGHIYFEGQDVWAKPKEIRSLRFSVGLLFQDPEYQLFEETVEADIAFGPKNMGLAKDEIDRRVREALRAVGLDDSCLKASPFALSGGEKRRVAMAGVLAMEPKVLILDEPTAGLDPAGRESLLSLIRDYHEKKGNTIVMVSHSMEEMARFADRLLVLKDAKVLMEGKPSELFPRVRELREAGLMPPEAAEMAQALRDRGIALPKDIFTVDALAEALCALKGGERGC